MTAAEPTQEQVDQSIVAQQELETAMDRMITEGFDYRAVITGAAAAVINSLTESAGPASVPVWFLDHYRLTQHLSGGRDRQTNT